MKLVFELSKQGRASALLPECDVPEALPNAAFRRAEAPALPEVAEVDLDRHYNGLADEAFGVCNGFYPLGSCTMKYNPRINEEVSALPGFSDIHPLQPEGTVQGALEAMATACDLLAEITGMDAVTLQPAAGAQGEFTGLLLIRAYHKAAGDDARTKIIVPDSAHGTNPATASMAGFDTINVPSNESGGVDLEALRAAVGPDTAGLMLTNPNTLGLFDPNIIEICSIVHEAGGLCYYDGANLNPIMGIARPGDMGFDCVHLNLHKTFSTPHGGGGPGSGPVGCKAHLKDFLPAPIVEKRDGAYALVNPERSIGRMKSFYGNFGVAIRALAYILALGKDGIPEAARTAVLNANYLMSKLEDRYAIPFAGPCMHEFVMDIGPLKEETGASALDVAKRFLDFGMHPPTMYFPLIVHEALMVEPTETESRETLDAAAEAFLAIWDEAHDNAEALHNAPLTTRIGRPDEVRAARNPVVRWMPDARDFGGSDGAKG
ncbi:aminomethyl-transferring glycine dehydrogenase subunit GcvPB [Raoultibacter massiliensis]|uniref:aminomethyl-transferring glycine dehydrogenase subunit GcvPB n=1 Tax=Raoultibacter massiliensis TaxID=1852371 RepID=UPI003A9213B4